MIKWLHNVRDRAARLWLALAGRPSRRLTLRPGDILVVYVDSHLTDELYEHLLQSVRSVFGEDQKIMVIEPGVEFGVIRRELAERPAPREDGHARPSA